MNVTTRRALKEDLEKIYRFNEKYYSRLNHGKEYVDFWCSKEENALERILLMVDENNDIIAQNFFSSMSYFYAGNKIETVWGFDLLVNEEGRKQNLGVQFMLRQRDAEKNMLSVGANDIALSMLLNMHYKKIGELKTYIGIGNPLWLFQTLFKSNDIIEKCPLQIKVDSFTFTKTKVEDIPDLNEPLNFNLLEPGRDKDFIRWRFFNKFHKYAFYRLEGTQFFFVVRPIKKYHFSIMELVDYRCNVNDKTILFAIIKAFKYLANKMHYALLYTGSSLKIVDEALEYNGLKKIRKNRPIIWLKKTDDIKDKIIERNFIYLTLADSDGEIAL